MSSSVRQVSGTFISPFALATRPQTEQAGGQKSKGKVVGTVRMKSEPAPKDALGFVYFFPLEVWIPNFTPAKRIL